MAGVNMAGDYGKEVTTTDVPAIGGKEYRASIGLSPEAQEADVVTTDHLNQGGTPPSYPENPGVSLDGGAYPTGTAFKDPTPGESIN